MKNTILFILLISLFGLSNKTQAQIVIQDDSTYNTLHQMLLANELFESGEPFAESLGYNLDDLDPMILNTPDSIAYTTGIENYEYSRYLLSTLTARSGLGLHMMWSPVVSAQAAMQDASFDGSFTGGVPNGFKEDDMLMMMIGNFGMNANQTPPANAFPQFADFKTGNNNLPQNVTADFQMNFGSTRWDRSLMDKTLNLGAMGQSMWKQYFWAQDMLSAFHDGDDNEVVPDGSNSPDFPDSPEFDPNNNIYYGGNNLDGYIGQVLTAVAINKTLLLLNQLAYDGSNLGAVNPATYDPSNGIQYFPSGIAVTETSVSGSLPPKATSFTVTYESSNLLDQLSYLLASSSFKNMMNPDDSSDAAHLAYHEVFDGYPFPADMASTGTPGPYDLMTGASKVLFLNIMAMHYNTSAGTFVDAASLDGSGQVVMGNEISTENAAYAIVALSKFSQEFTGTPLKPIADAAIIAEAEFIINNLKDSNGGFYNAYEINIGASTDAKKLSANTAAIRGLYAAYQATNNASYLTEANNAYTYLINNFYITNGQVFKTTLGEDTAMYTPYNLALLSGALREASLVGAQSDAAIIYTRVFKRIYNKMLLTEAEASGETGSDSDADDIPYIVGGTKPFVFADKASLNLTNLGVISLENNAENMVVYPNPSADIFHLQMDIKQSSNMSFRISNLLSETVLIKNSSLFNEGQHTVEFSLNSLQNGIYFLQIFSNNKPIRSLKILKK